METALNWSPKQYAAIHAKEKRLLISASAGTGKTEVLSERVLDMVAHRGFSLDRMIIVTFTKAAAAEMRVRIVQKLREAVPEDPRLQRQVNMAPMALITTIDALCQKIVRAHFEAVDVDPTFTICQGADWEEESTQAMNEAMEIYYGEARENAELSSLSAKFEEDQIRKATMALYEFLCSLPNPEEWIQPYLEKEYTPEDLYEESFGQALFSQVKKRVEQACSLHDEAAEMYQKGEIDDRFGSNINSDGEILHRLRAASGERVDSLRRTLLSLPTWSRKVPVKSGEEVEGAETFSEMRDRYKKIVKEAAELLAAPPEQLAKDLNDMQPALRGLYRAVCLYRDRLKERLSARRMLSFSDVQRLALEILRKPSLQADFTAGYDGVFVDECQDVSPMQEELLSRLSREDSSSFWVGDVKQSIYRFRQADASLFLEKQSRYRTAEGSRERILYLTENFRSRSAIQQAINRVFFHVMRQEITEIQYDDDAALTSLTPTLGDVPVEIHILNKKELDQNHDQDEEMQMLWAALDIKKRVEAGERLPNRDGTPGDPLRYGDFLILSPTKEGVMGNMERILRQVGIPCMVSDGQNAVKTMEIRQILSFLECILDEENDYSLLAALRSPLLRFGERELAEIRLQRKGKRISFRQALEEAAETAPEPLRSKCADTLSLFQRERQLAAHSELCPYLWGLIRRTGYDIYVSTQEEGARRQANLEYLCDQAADWDRNRSDGMAGFVTFMRKLSNQKDGANPAINRPGENAVKLMTIHKSKGLGSRAVYVLLMNKELKNSARKDAPFLSFHKNVGVSLEYRDETTRLKRETILHNAVSEMEENANRAEKARLLYVAMTRAREKLVLVGSRKLDEDMETLLKQAWLQKNMDGVASAGCYLDWLMQAINENDRYIELKQEELSTFDQKTVENIHKETVDNPQVLNGFQYVFHKKPLMPKEWIKKWCGSVLNETKYAIELIHNGKLDEDENGFATENVENLPDPLLPSMENQAALHKIGVTTLLRLRAAARNIPFGQEETPEETREIKREPLIPQKQRVWPEEMPLPESLLPEEEKPFNPAARGTLTHLVLELLDLDLAREAVDMESFVRTQIRQMVNLWQLTQEEAEQVNIHQVADFLQSNLGRRILNALVVRREMSFTLQTEDPPHTLVQGIVDLCFLEPGRHSWVLVDFKTDRVDRVEELVQRYRDQLNYYCQAVTQGTGMPVSEMILYSLRLRQSVSVKTDVK